MRYRLWRATVFVVATLFPLVWLYLGLTHQTGPDPGKILVINLGVGALVLLLLSLGMTPMRRLTAWGGWLAVRRQLGLWCFAYAVLHVSAYLLFLLGLRMDRLLADLGDRPYIMVGALALLGLTPLALTSNRWSQRTLGGRWRKLHRLVYPIAGLVLLHMLWVVRSDVGEWLLYAVVAGLLMMLRTPAVTAAMGHLREKMTRIFQKSLDGRI